MSEFDKYRERFGWKFGDESFTKSGLKSTDQRLILETFVPSMLTPAINPF
jgi:hypothetical protein